MKPKLIHNWRCACLKCGVARSEYHKQYRNGLRLYVPADQARQLLLTFEDAKDAARALRMPVMTVWRIRKGKVKSIRRSTEERILLAVAA